MVDFVAPGKRHSRSGEIAPRMFSSHRTEPPTRLSQFEGIAIPGLCCVSSNALERIRTILIKTNSQESLRVYPPVPMTFREAAKSDYIDGVFVPKGTYFYIPVRPSFFFSAAEAYGIVDSRHQHLERGLGRGC